MLNYEDRYSPGWSSRAKKIRKLVKGQCSNCYWRRSSVVHHMVYKDIRGAIKGRELAGIHCIPLCDRCHDSEHRRPGSAHGNDNWIYAKHNPVLNNHNILLYRLKSIFKFWILFILLEYWFILIPGLSTIIYLKLTS